MSTNSNPRSAPSSRARSESRTRDRAAARSRSKARLQRAGTAARAQKRDNTKAPETWQERLRHYFAFAIVPNAVLALGAVAVCFAVLLIGGWPLPYLPLTIGEFWLVGHGVPATIDGVTLGAVPLLPAVGVVALVATRVRAATEHRVSVLDLWALLGLTLAIPLVCSAIALFMVADASKVYATSAPPAWQALSYPLALHFIGFCFGLRTVLWRALAKRISVPPMLIDAALTAAQATRNLLAAGGVVFLILLAFNYQRVGEAIASFPNLGAVGGIWLLLVCLLYLPNAAIATLAVLLGGAFEYAGVATSLFATGNVALPPLPVLAAVPASVPAWAPVAMVIPAAVILASLWKVRPSAATAGAIGAWAGVYGLVLGALASGVAGAYGMVGPTYWMLGGLMFAWVAVIALLVWCVAWVRERGVEKHPAPEATKPEGD